MRALLFAAAILAATPALACGFNTDCNVGSKCVKRSGALYEVCVGGMFPGRPESQEEQQQKNRDPYRWSTSKRNGEQCSFTTDCEVGSVCLKEAGRLYGVCFKR